MDTPHRTEGRRGEGGLGGGPRGVASYIDATVVQSVLAGLAVLVLAVGAKYVLNRLWQVSLAQDAAGAIQAATEMGLEILPLGYGAEIRAVGVVGTQSVEVSWTGGVFGSRTQIQTGDQTVVVPLVKSKMGLHALLMNEE